jgi:hypothetical protein
LEDLLRRLRRLVQERRGAEDDLRRLLLGQASADLGRGLVLAEDPAARGAAGQACLQADQGVQVLRIDELAKVPLDEDPNRLVAKPVVEVLGGRKCTSEMRIESAITGAGRSTAQAAIRVSKALIPRSG